MLPGSMHRSSALVAALPLLLCSCGTDGFFEVISPYAPGSGDKSCDQSTRGSVSSIEVGEMMLDDMGATAFVPLDEGAMAMVIRGTQGADMLVLALRASGVSSPRVCLDQRTDITDEAGERVSFNSVAKLFIQQPDGTSLCQQTYFPGLYTDGRVTIQVALGGKTLVRHVEVAP